MLLPLICGTMLVQLPLRLLLPFKYIVHCLRYFLLCGSEWIPLLYEFYFRLWEEKAIWNSLVCGPRHRAGVLNFLFYSCACACFVLFTLAAYAYTSTRTAYIYYHTHGRTYTQTHLLRARTLVSLCLTIHHVSSCRERRNRSPTSRV